MAVPVTVLLGPCPCDETPTQVGEPNYLVNAIRQCRQYVAAIRNYLGPEPAGAALDYREFAHELGNYFEVVCDFDPNVPAAAAYARRCEGQAPHTWAEGGVRAPVLLPPVDRSRRTRMR